MLLLPSLTFCSGYMNLNLQLHILIENRVSLLYISNCFIIFLNVECIACFLTVLNWKKTKANNKTSKTRKQQNTPTLF